MQLASTGSSKQIATTIYQRIEILMQKETNKALTSLTAAVNYTLSRISVTESILVNESKRLNPSGHRQTILGKLKHLGSDAARLSDLIKQLDHPSPKQDVSEDT